MPLNISTSDKTKSAPQETNTTKDSKLKTTSSKINSSVDVPLNNPSSNETTSRLQEATAAKESESKTPSINATSKEDVPLINSSPEENRSTVQESITAKESESKTTPIDANSKADVPLSNPSPKVTKPTSQETNAIKDSELKQTQQSSMVQIPKAEDVQPQKTDEYNNNPNKSKSDSQIIVPRLTAPKIYLPGNNSDVYYCRDNNKITFSWDKIEGATKYKFALYHNDEFSWGKDIAKDETSCEFGILGGDKYRIVLSAVDALGRETSGKYTIDRGRIVTRYLQKSPDCWDSVDIEVLNQRLSNFGLPVPVNNHFGEETEDAIKAVQMVMWDDDINGIVDGDVWKSINTLTKEMNDYSQNNNFQSQQEVRDALNKRYKEAKAPKMLLAVGSNSSEEIKILQERLNDLGLETGGITGEFNHDTLLSVNAIQRGFHLTERGNDTGTAGPLTWNKIWEQEYNRVNSLRWCHENNADFFAPGMGGYNLRGDRADLVREEAERARIAAEEEMFYVNDYMPPMSDEDYNKIYNDAKLFEQGIAKQYIDEINNLFYQKIGVSIEDLTQEDQKMIYYGIIFGVDDNLLFSGGQWLTGKQPFNDNYYFMKAKSFTDACFVAGYGAATFGSAAAAAQALVNSGAAQGFALATAPTGYGGAAFEAVSVEELARAGILSLASGASEKMWERSTNILNSDTQKLRGLRKTSITINPNKPIETTIDGRKVQLRVDVEPDANKIQIQDGYGANSFIDRRIDPNLPIEPQIPNIIKRNLSSGQLQDLIRRIEKAKKYLY